MPMPTDLGIIDLMLGFPHTSIEEKRATYDFFRPLLKDEQSAKDFEFPAEYMFKGVPDVVDPDTDVVQWVVDKMDAFGIEVAMTGLTARGIEARERFPSRFVLNLSVRPNEGMDAIRAMTQAKEEHGIVSVSVFPSDQVPQVVIDIPLMFLIVICALELDVPVCVNAGIVGPRMPSSPQEVMRLDRVCYDFPELTLCTMHGCEPWTALAVKLMLKWPGLHYMTSAFAPKHYPADIIKYANTRGADKIMYCGYFPAGLTLERQFADLPNVPFKDEVWPKFLRENALRVFKIAEATGRA